MARKVKDNDWKIFETGWDMTYKSHWDNPWYVVREFMQNAMDEHDLGGITELPILEKRRTSLIIRDKGRGLRASSLILREVKTDSDIPLRGQFGEGMKWACICALRLGFKVKITSPTTEIVPFVNRVDFDGETLDLMAFRWRNTERARVGTEVVISKYNSLLFDDRFYPLISGMSSDVFLHGKNSVQIGVNCGNRLFVRDIFVRHIGDDSGFTSRFDYNFWDVELDPDRVQVRNNSDLEREVARIWSQCNDIYLLGQLLEAVVSGEWEKRIYWPYYVFEDRAKWREAWNDRYGKDSVLHTSEFYSNRLKERNQRVIYDFEGTFRDTLLRVGIPSDKDSSFEEQVKKKEEHVPVLEQQLGYRSGNNLRVMRALLRQLHSSNYCWSMNIPFDEVTVEAALLTDGASVLLGMVDGNKIMLHFDSLDNFWESFNRFVSQLARIDSHNNPSSYDSSLKTLWVAFFKVAVVHSKFRDFKVLIANIDNDDEWKDES